jgi:hypothetical protein
MPPTNVDAQLIVFAKAPQPGAVKTRLVPLLGETGAAALHARLVEHTLVTACASEVGPVELCCAPCSDDPFFGYCGARYAISLSAQAEGDLGARMLDAFGRALITARHAILIGTDCAALTVSHLRQAARTLAEGTDAVLIPAEDGGYALIGLNRYEPMLFHAIEWGGATVMAATRERLHRLQWSWRELDTLWDVDRPGDYQRLAASGLMEEKSTHA